MPVLAYPTTRRTERLADSAMLRVEHSARFYSRSFLSVCWSFSTQLLIRLYASSISMTSLCRFFFQAEDGIRDSSATTQTNSFAVSCIAGTSHYALH